MAVEKIQSLCPENNAFTNDAESLNISAEQEAAVNFEAAVPLNYGADHVIIEQMNTGVEYTIPATDTTPEQKVVSKRLWAAEMDDNENVVSLRTLGVPSIRNIAFSEKTKDSTPPVVGAVKDAQGKWKAEKGAYTLQACADTSFIKGQDRRYVVVRPVTIVPTRKAVAYVPTYKDKKLVTKSGNCVVEVNDRFHMFQVVGTPSEAVIAKVLEAIKNDPTASKHFYARS